jgi:hypothetical protein
LSPLRRNALTYSVAAAILTIVAYPLYTHATKGANVELGGFILVLTDNSDVSVRVTVRYAANYVKKAQESSYTTANLGDDEIHTVVVSLMFTGDILHTPRHVLLLLGGDARVSKEDLSDEFKKWSVPRLSIKYRGVSAVSDVQGFEGRIPMYDKAELQLAGYLTKSVVDSGAGQTMVRIPSLGTAVDAHSATTGDVNEEMKPQIVRVATKNWYTPKDVAYIAEVGRLNAGTQINAARPAVDTAESDRLRWTGKSVVYPEAQLIDGVAQQRSAKELFLAGVMAGLASGLFVEGLTRVRIRRESGLGSTEDSMPSGPEQSEHGVDTAGLIPDEQRNEAERKGHSNGSGEGDP